MPLRKVNEKKLALPRRLANITPSYMEGSTGYSALGSLAPDFCMTKTYRNPSLFIYSLLFFEKINKILM